MNIDTLNAHCGPWLVHCPCLAQGRLNIHHREDDELSLLYELGFLDCVSVNKTDCRRVASSLRTSDSLPWASVDSRDMTFVIPGLAWLIVLGLMRDGF